MEALRFGSSGDNVEKWQIFLRGQKKSSQIIANGEFDQTTVDETKNFQKSCGLVADGIVGPATILAASQRGFLQLTQKHNNWPTIPPGVKNISPLERGKLFGTFRFESSPTKFNPEAIKIVDGWDKQNIISIEVPQLAGVTGARKDLKIDIHKLVAPQLLSLFQDWEEAGFKDRILSWGGAWAPRFIRGSRTSLSNHAWGTAFDINVQWNGLGSQPAQLGEKGCVRELVELANENGFYWGGWFPNRPDGMHFEVYKIIS